MRLNIKRVPETLLQSFGAKFFLVPVAIGFVLNFSSCDKSSTVGLNVLPASDMLNVLFDDTTKLVTKTVREDHLRTDQGLITSGTGMIGKYNDPIFGLSEASIFTQLRQPNNSPGFGNNPICDSAVLILIYKNAYYGEAVGRKPLRLQKVSVYELGSEISNAVPYYSDTVAGIQISNRDLVTPNHWFEPELSNLVHVGAETPRAELRLPLETIFGQTLLNNQATGNIASNTTFQQLLKGLYITAKGTTGLGPGEGRILYYDLQNSESKLQIYYHSDTAHGDYSYHLNGVRRFAHFERDTVNRSAGIIAQVADINPTNYPTTYIQAMAGLKTKITMPDILSKTNGVKISINKAELIVKVDPTYIDYRDDSFEPPAKLLLLGIDESGNSYVMSDLYEPVNSPGYYDGSYNATTHEYTLKCSRYIQDVLDKKVKNLGMYLEVAHIQAATSANRVVIGGGDNTGGTNGLQMKLNLTYTKLH